MFDPTNCIMNLKGRIALVLALSTVAAVAPAVAQAYDETRHVTRMNKGDRLAIGDSHTWIAAAGTQYPSRWDVDCRPGRASQEGEEVLDQLLRRRHDVVVFDLATNDFLNANAFRQNLRDVWQRIGRNRELVLVTTWRIDSLAAAIGVNAVNAEIREFTDKHPNRSTRVRFGYKARSNSSLFGSDGVHFTSGGYQLRTQMVRAAE